MSKIKFYKDSAKTQQVYPELDPEDITKFESLEDIENAFPNVSGEDANLTLNHTVEAPMRLELAPSELEQETTTGKNLANIHAIANAHTQYISREIVGDTIVLSDNTNSSGYLTTEKKLKQICPNLKVDDVVKLSFKTTTTTATPKNAIYLNGVNELWYINGEKTITQEMLDSTVILYGGYNETCVISEFMIRLSSTAATPYEKYTGSIQAPNPEYPQDIHVVSGDNTIEVIGKNLLNLSKCSFNRCVLNGDNSIKSDISNSYYCAIDANYLIDYFFANKGKYMTFSIGTGIPDRRLSIVITGVRTGGELNQEVNSASGAKSVTLKIANDFTKITNIQLRFNRAQTPFTDTTTVVVNLMLEQQNSNTSYLPYIGKEYPISLGDLEYCKIGNYADEFYKPKGYNLLTVPFTQHSNTTLKSEIPNFKAGTYSLSVVYTGNSFSQITARKMVDGTLTQILYKYNSNNLTFTLDEDATLQLELYKNSGLSINDISNAMLNEGYASLPYEPLNDNKWYLKKEVYKGDFGLIPNRIVPSNGDENSRTQGLFQIEGISPTPVYLPTGTFITPTDTMSNKYQNGHNYSYFVPGRNPKDKTMSRYGYMFYVQNSDFSGYTNEQVRTALTGTTIYYPLAAPQFILLNDTLQHQLDDIYNWVESHPEQTNILQINNDLPFIISAHAIKDLSVIDEYPTENSEHLVESGGVYEVVNDINERIADINNIRHDSKNVVYGTSTGTNIIIDDAYDTNLAELKLHKETTQITTTGANLLNVFDKADNFTVDSNGWITAVVDNVSGTTQKFSNFNIHSSNLITTSTNYAIMLEVKDVGSRGSCYFTLNEGSTSQFENATAIHMSNLTPNTVTKIILSTKSTFQSTDRMIRGYLYAAPGGYGSITFRLSVLEDTTVTTNDFVYEPYSGKTSAPNTSFPMDVKVVEGYKNLFDKNNANYLKGYLTAPNGITISNSDNQNKMIYIPCEPNTEYTVSKNIVANPFRIGSSSVEPSSSVTTITKVVDGLHTQSLTITTGVNDAYLIVYYYNSLNTTYAEQDILDTLTIYKGNKVYTSVPYGNNNIIFDITGENLFNVGKKQNYSNGSVVDSIENDIVYIKIIGSGGTYTYNCLNRYEINQNYYISGKTSISQSRYYIRIRSYDDTRWLNNNDLILDGWTYNQYYNGWFREMLTKTPKVSINVNQGLYWQLGLGFQTTTPGNIEQFSDIMVTKGTTETTYEPYQGQSILLPLNNNWLAEKNDYADKYIIDKSTGKHYLYKVWNKITLDGSENWGIDGDYYYITSPGSIFSSLTEAFCDYCLYYKNKTGEPLEKFFLTRSGSGFLEFSKYTFTTADDFKTWLSTHNVTVYYAPSTSRLIELPEADITLFDGINQITNNEDATMQIEYVEDINIVINKLTNAIIEIGGE